jgi:arylsulfatase A
MRSTRFWQWNRGTPCYSHNAAMRDGPWKLVYPFVTRNMVRAESREPARLFNIADDPFEEHDLAFENPQRVTAMTNELAQWATSVEQDRLRSRPHEDQEGADSWGANTPDACDGK